MSATATLPPPTWTTGRTDVFKTGSWRAARPLHVQAPAPCHAACPVHGDIAEWIGHAREGRLRAAWDALVRHNPFPAVAGRVCHHPCETACNRGGFDEAIAICKLERHVGDAAIEAGWGLAAEPLHGGRAAVVGGGPAGLSAAYQLRRRGWHVTLVEARAELGGLMRHGIPSYRLSREVLDAEIGRIVAMGLDLRLATPLTPALLAELRATHDTVFAATGAALPKRLGSLDYAQPWALDGAAFLEAANAGRAPAGKRIGPRVVVVGGGSAAFDAARSARRRGHAVTVLALESRAALPAQPEEVAEALDEGIELLCGAQLLAARPEAGALLLACERVDFRPGRVVPQPDSGFVVAADTVIASIGNDADLAPFGGRLPDGIHAGGDLASFSRHVTEAVAMGERAALAIDRARSGAAEAAPPAAGVVTLAQIATAYHERAPRAASHTRPAADRAADDDEVQLALTSAEALAETQRCFSCGTCVHCDTCVVVCPDLAVRAADGGYEVLTDWCKGCGLCVRECPTGSMLMVEERR